MSAPDRTPHRTPDPDGADAVPAIRPRVVRVARGASLARRLVRAWRDPRPEDWLLRTVSWALAMALLVALCYAGWVRGWYGPPPAPAPDPDASERAGGWTAG